MAKTNIGKRSEIREYFEVDAESGVKKAHVNFVPLQNKPVAPFGRLPKLKENNNPMTR